MSHSTIIMVCSNLNNNNYYNITISSNISYGYLPVSSLSGTILESDLPVSSFLVDSSLADCLPGCTFSKINNAWVDKNCAINY